MGIGTSVINVEDKITTKNIQVTGISTVGNLKISGHTIQTIQNHNNINFEDNNLITGLATLGNINVSSGVGTIGHITISNNKIEAKDKIINFNGTSITSLNGNANFSNMTTTNKNVIGP